MHHMRGWVGLICGVAVLGCDARKEPPAVAPKRAPVVVADAGAPTPDAGPPKEEEQTDNVLQLPSTDNVIDDVSRLEGLVQLLLRDPQRAERALMQLETPDSWQVALMAQFALKRGERTAAAPAEDDLPTLKPDNAGKISAGAKAWVAAVSLPLKALPGAAPKRQLKPAVLLEVPINTPVQIESLDGPLATVTVEVATEVEFGDSGLTPKSVTTRPVRGTLDAAWLVPEPLSGASVMADARAQDNTPEGRARAVVLWHRALLLERSDRAREGLLRAATQAQRASWVVLAALTRNLAPASRVELAFGCLGDSPKAQWLSRAKLPKKLPADVCFTGVDARPPCPDATAKEKKAAEASRQWRESLSLKEAPVLRLTVDARQPRIAFVARSTLKFHDSCDDFQEVDVESWGATLRRLPLPLGTATTVVRVPVERYHGVEYAVISAASETKAAAWLRTRGRYRYTVDGRGDLRPSLQLNDLHFESEPDVGAATFATLPAKYCECGEEP